MEAPKAFERSASVVTLLALAVALVMIPQAAYGQATTVPCSAAMLSSFTPCLNFLANSTSNGTSPTSDCCSSLQGILSNGTDCFCQIATGAVRIPFRIPINRTVVMSLPKACKMSGVPLKCKSAAAPIPAPGPTAFSPVPSPAAAAAAPSPFGTTTPAAGSPAAQGPGSDTTPSSTGTSLPPTSTSTGGSSTLNPTASGASRSFTASLLPVTLAAMIFKYYC